MINCLTDNIYNTIPIMTTSSAIMGAIMVNTGSLRKTRVKSKSGLPP